MGCLVLFNFVEGVKMVEIVVEEVMGLREA
jgi:hypothetical protein